NKKVAEINVGKEPWCVAITPGRKPRADADDNDDHDDVQVFVAHMGSGTVSFIAGKQMKLIDTIKVGTEPFGCALTPDGSRLYVANQSSETVSVIDTRNHRAVGT